MHLERIQLSLAIEAKEGPLKKLSTQQPLPLSHSERGRASQVAVTLSLSMTLSHILRDFL
jgi:hypothetical protein